MSENDRRVWRAYALAALRGGKTGREAAEAADHLRAAEHAQFATVEVESVTRREAHPGIYSTGFRDLDGLLAGGLRKGAVTLLACEKGAGATTLALQIAAPALVQHTRVLYLTVDAGAVTERAKTLMHPRERENIVVRGAPAGRASIDLGGVFAAVVDAERAAGARGDLVILDTVNTAFVDDDEQVGTPIGCGAVLTYMRSVARSVGCAVLALLRCPAGVDDVAMKNSVDVVVFLRAHGDSRVLQAAGGLVRLDFDPVRGFVEAASILADRSR